MKIFKLIGASAMIIAATGDDAVAADKVDLGKPRSTTRTASPATADLKGGALSISLKVTPPDLTRLSEERRGFPLERVYAVIDGRQEVKAHGAARHADLGP